MNVKNSNSWVSKRIPSKTWASVNKRQKPKSQAIYNNGPNM